MPIDQYLNLFPQSGQGGSVLFVLALKRALERSSLPLNQSYLALHLVQLRGTKLGFTSQENIYGDKEPQDLLSEPIVLVKNCNYFIQHLVPHICRSYISSKTSIS